MAADDESTNQFDRTGADAAPQSFHVQHEWRGPETLVHDVIRTVSAVTGRTMAELEPVPTVIDPDALNGLFRDRQHAGEPDDVVRFEYGGCEVCVQRDGQLVVRSPSPSAPWLM